MMTDKLERVHYSTLISRMRNITGSYAMAVRVIKKTENAETAMEQFIRLTKCEEKFFLVADFAEPQAQSKTRKRMLEERIACFEEVKAEFYATVIEKVEMFGIIQ